MCNYALLMPEAKKAAGLYQQGLSMRQVAERFGVSQQAVKSALVLLDVPRRDKHEARKARRPHRTYMNQPAPIAHE